MKTYYNILKLVSKCEKPEAESAAADNIISFGPPFRSKGAAKLWLKKNLVPEAEFAILRFYALSVPESLQRKKNKK